MSLFRSLAASAAVLLLSLCSAAQSSRSMPGVVVDPGEHPLRVLAAPQTAENVHVSVPVLIPRWDGRNDAGDALPARHLRTVQLEARVRMNVHGAGENVASTPTARWRVETGVTIWWRRDGTAERYGGGSLSTYTAAGHALAAFDGDLDGLGGSGWTEEAIGTPITAEHVHVGTTRDDLRAWCGAGSILLHIEPQVVTQDRGFTGHWREWSTIEFQVIDVSVRYFLDQAPLAGAWRVEHGPWVDHGILEAGDAPVLLDVPGSPNPVQVLATRFELAHEDHRWIGLENLAPFAATCGGSASGGVLIAGPDSEPGPVLYSNAAAGVGTFAPVAGWDGATDWSGPSGRESWGSAYATGVLRGAWRWGDGWAARDARLDAHVGHASIDPESLTPGATFDWDGAWRFTGRVRAVRIVTSAP